MSKNLRKIAAFVLAMVLCMSAFTAAQAGAWYGGNLSVTITKGEKGYTFQSVYSAPTHAYEMSGHMVSSDGVSHAIPQTLVLVPADSSYTWTPNGMYGAGANYEVLYCCDAVTGYDNGIHYKRMNLEDSAYYTPAAADKIRAIVSISYPFRSMDEMKAALRAKGFADANKLTRSEIISAVQAAIWYYANGVKYSYSRTFEVASNSQWGGVMHEYGAEGYENQTWLPVGKRKFAVNTEVGARIDALRDFLIALPGVDAREGQIVITGLDILGFTPSRNGDGTYDVEIKAELNTKAKKKTDHVTLTILVNGEAVVTVDDFNGTSFKATVEAKSGDTIEAIVSGTQVLDAGVYFYEPEGGRSKSQCLVGVARGATSVYAAASVVLTVEDDEEEEVPEDSHEFRFPAGGASNISYMLINRETGKVEFVKKVDLNDGDTAMPIITQEGYISAMFVKQSTSGKFWIAEEVDDATVEAVIACLKANNPSYSGHDEQIAFGYGTHTLTYAKKNGKIHTIPYIFK